MVPVVGQHLPCQPCPSWVGTRPTLHPRPATTSPVFLRTLQMQPPTKGPSSCHPPDPQEHLPAAGGAADARDDQEAQPPEGGGERAARAAGSGEGEEGCWSVPLCPRPRPREAADGAEPPAAPTGAAAAGEPGGDALRDAQGPRGAARAGEARSAPAGPHGGVASPAASGSTLASCVV